MEKKQAGMSGLRVSPRIFLAIFVVVNNARKNLNSRNSVFSRKDRPPAPPVVIDPVTAETLSAFISN